MLDDLQPHGPSTSAKSRLSQLPRSTGSKCALQFCFVFSSPLVAIGNAQGDDIDWCVDPTFIPRQSCSTAEEEQLAGAAAQCIWLFNLKCVCVWSWKERNGVVGLFVLLHFSPDMSDESVVFSTPQPPGSVNGALRVTEQGEMVQAKFGLPGIAERQLELYITAVARATLSPPSPPRQGSWYSLMDNMGRVSCDMYRDIVRNRSEFLTYFTSCTPEGEMKVEGKRRRDQ